MLEFNTGDVIVDRYRIKGKIGKGGMGEVYMVRDIKTGERLALKTLLPQFAQDKKVVDRFIREVNAQRILDHPGIIQIFGARQVENTLFYVMEYLDGVSVRGLIKRGKISVKSTFRILYLLCDALDHAHEHTIHRDLSPDNVMVLRDGVVKLLDFGLAKLTESDSDLTRTGIFIGKIHYSAPEQGVDAKSVDLRADIYSIGVMFHEMLSGDLPFANKKLTQLVPELPKECDDFVEKARALDPGDRFQSAKEFQNELVRIYGIIAGESVPDPEIYDNRLPDFVSDSDDIIQTLKQHMIPSSNTPSNRGDSKESKGSSRRSKSKSPDQQTALKENGGSDSKVPPTSDGMDQAIVDTLRQEIYDQEKQYEQIKEGMQMLAIQMQEFLDEQSDHRDESKVDHKDLQRLLGDVESQRKILEDLIESVATDSDSARTYAVQFKMLESGLKSAQADLLQHNEQLDRLRTDLSRERKSAKKSEPAREPQTEKRQVKVAVIPVRIALIGLVLVAAITWALAILVG
mgnify:CR=1 FL=1